MYVAAFKSLKHAYWIPGDEEFDTKPIKCPFFGFPSSERDKTCERL